MFTINKIILQRLNQQNVAPCTYAPSNILHIKYAEKTDN